MRPGSSQRPGPFASASRRCQDGAALIVLLIVLVLATSAVLLDRRNSGSVDRTARNETTARALADAKTALIAWAVTAYSSGGRPIPPGRLPFPDRNLDGNYDGKGDCVTFGLNPSHLLGRLPWAGDVSPCPRIHLHIDARDAAGESLWYAVSRNLVTRGGGGPINPDMGGPGRMVYPWITLRDSRGNVITEPNSDLPLPVAAVIIAPGPALTDQDRSGPAPEPANYLDSIMLGATTYDNADADGCPDSMTAPCGSPPLGEEFVIYRNPNPEDNFNDRVVYISVDELMRAVEKRALGEVAVALNDYRSAYDVYPWLAPFRSPRGRFSGSVFVAAGNDITDSLAEFTAAPDPVQPGDVLVNISDGGSRGPVIRVGVPATSILTHDGLQGGTTNTFSPGDSYVVEPKFKSTVGTREGSLAVHLPNEIFYTSFTPTWNFVDATETTATEKSASAHVDTIPPSDDLKSDASAFPAAPSRTGVPDTVGQCMWTEPGAVNCRGSETWTVSRMVGGVPTTLDRTVSYSLSFSSPNFTITPPAVGDVRRRTVSIGANPLPPATAVAAPLLPRCPCPTDPPFPAALVDDPWTITIRDVIQGDPGKWGERSIVIDGDTSGSITVAGIRYDLSVVYDDVNDGQDELPEWLVENNWHHFIYAAISADTVAGGNADADNDCATPANTCLTLTVGGATARNDIRALVVSAGVEWTAQERTLGDCNGDGDGLDAEDGYLCSYFEGENNDKPAATPDVFARDLYSNTFNDQIRIVEPLPP